MTKKKNEANELLECIRFAKEMCKLNEADKKYIAGLVKGMLIAKEIEGGSKDE